MGRTVKEELAKRLNIGESDLDIFSDDTGMFKDNPEIAKEFVEYYINDNVVDCEKSIDELKDMLRYQAYLIYDMNIFSYISIIKIKSLIESLLVLSLVSSIFYLLAGITTFHSFLRIYVVVYLSINSAFLFRTIIQRNSLRRIMGMYCIPLEKVVLYNILPIALAVTTVGIGCLSNVIFPNNQISLLSIVSILTCVELSNLYLFKNL